MNDSIYNAPTAELDEASVSGDHEFYVVGYLKFSILFFATFGIYTVYWFYRNWKLYKARHNEDIWPVARGIFSIFFAHSLFELVNGVIQDKGLLFKWSPSGLATLYVLFSVCGRITDKLSEKDIGTPFTHFASILFIFTTWFVLGKVQRAINLSQDDRLGDSNSKFTLANYLWCIPGLLIWVVVAIGLTAIFGVIE